MRQVSSRVVEAFWHRSAIFMNIAKFVIEKRTFALCLSIYFWPTFMSGLMRTNEIRDIC